MTMKEDPEINLGSNNDFNIDDDDDDDQTNMMDMLPTSPDRAPTMDEIRQETTSTNNAVPPSNGSFRIPTARVTTTTASEAAAALRMTAPLSIDNNDNDNATTAANANNNNNNGRTQFGPSGRWKNSLFSCCGTTFFTSLFWTGFFCTPCLLGQLMQRLGLSCTGMPTFDRETGRRTASTSPGVCLSILVVTSLVYASIFLFSGWMVDAIWYAFLFYVLFAGILVRNVIRQHFGIGPLSRRRTAYCDGMLEDCLVALLCSCCSGIQMARHTHDEEQYPYNAGSTNGLSSWAPDMWQVNNLLEDGGGGGTTNTTRSVDTTNMRTVEIV